MEYKGVHLSDGSDITVASNDVSKVTKLDADNSEKAKQVADIKAQIKALQAKLDKLQLQRKQQQRKLQLLKNQQLAQLKKQQRNNFTE